MTLTPPLAPNRKTYALVAAGVAAFVVYGSLLPFHFHPRPWGEVTDSFVWAMTHRLRIESRSDGLANVMLTIPLGFALLGAVRLEQPGGWRRDLVVGLMWLPACAALAAAVEFGQLFVPSRTCSGSDVWCQVLGAVIGMALWMGFGPALTAQMRVVWGHTQPAGAAGRMLVAYLALLALVQALPLDLNPSPRGLYRKLRDGGVRGVPFVEFHGVTVREIWGWFSGSGGGAAPVGGEEETWKQVGKLVQVFGLYLPAGLLAARLPGRFWGRASRVVIAAVGVAAVMEAIQLPVESRTPSSTDVLIGAAGAITGWGIGRRWPRGLGAGAALVLGQLWFAGLLIVYWTPFVARAEPASFDWVPGLPLESGEPLFTLEELLSKLMLFAPLGAFVVAAGRGRVGWGLLARAAAVGVGASAAIEIGQLFVDGHTPCITDVLLGGAGAYAGAWAAGRVSALGSNIQPRVY